MKRLRDDGSLQRSARTEGDNSRSRSLKKETTEAKTIQLDQRKGTMQQVRGTLCVQILCSPFSLLLFYANTR